MNLIKSMALRALILCGILAPVTSLGENEKTNTCAEALAGDLSTTDRLSAKEVFDLIQELDKAHPDLKPALQKQILQQIIRYNNKGLLDDLLGLIIRTAHQKELLPVKIEDDKKGSVDEKLNALTQQFYGLVDSTLISHGLTLESQGQEYRTWEKLAQDHKAIVDKNEELTNNSPVSSQDFQQSFAKLTRSTLRSGNQAKLLVDGPASFRARRTLIENIQEEMVLMTWGLHDDETGQEVYEQLAAVVKSGKKARVITDGQTAKRPGYNKYLKKMEEAGVEVIYWRHSHPLKKYMGQHRKIFIVDKVNMVTGGINPGNAYSHKAGDDKWRDTDILVSGPTAIDGYNLVVSLWNEQLVQHGLQYDPMRFAFPTVDNNYGENTMALVNHSPDQLAETGYIDNIYLSHLLAIRAAKTKIRIQNAYVILTPALKEELRAAIERGVEVEVLSNSDKSVDEPIVSQPIMKSLKELAAMGARVYLRKGSTLHSKVMLVDDYLAFIQSYNLHPRSLRLEGEAALAVFGGTAVTALATQMDKDIQAEHALAVNSADEIQIPPDVLGGIVEWLFFDQL